MTRARSMYKESVKLMSPEAPRASIVYGQVHTHSTLPFKLLELHAS